MRNGLVIAPFFFYRAASGFDPKAISVRPATGIPLDDPQRDVYFPDYNPLQFYNFPFEESQIAAQFERLFSLEATPLKSG